MFLFKQKNQKSISSLSDYLDLIILSDYVVRISLRNYKSLIHDVNPDCVSLSNINLDTDFISYGEKCVGFGRRDEIGKIE